MADGFIWYELITNDMDKAVDFYKKVVEWDVRDSGMPGMTYMLFGKDSKDVGGMMTWAGAGETGMPPVWMGHIHTAKLDEELKSVTADGGTIVKPAQDIPGVGRFAVVSDPQEVKYLLFEPGGAGAPPSRLGQGDAGNVGWHEMLTDDAAKAFEYYSKHYGWEKDFAHDMGAMGAYQTFRMEQPFPSGGMMNRKGPGMPEGIPPHWQFYFNVDDIEAAQKRVIDAGGTVTVPPMDVPGGSRILQGIDDQGGHFALTQGPKA
ncbi:Glyoxalase/Bleomycin resistance protein/dioxygenase domain [Granulicella sibirica]|uniref:Glyoxalase/Bleomycin resistance protein/dioxygenase domain n=2 Tax=Granulicella sibirica TaxID=2479048 RepID=A0A4Q0SYF8_9BACT|nr:Glyoxalase/Bleomycin resistance protein/dioxygenase domain [Granulicella sibirica]